MLFGLVTQNNLYNLKTETSYQYLVLVTYFVVFQDFHKQVFSYNDF